MPITPPSTPITLRDDCINFINNNNFIVTDVIRESERDEYKSKDNDLLPVTYNNSIIDMMMKMKGNNIYFTALPNNPSPWSWFQINILQPIVGGGNFNIARIIGTRNLILQIQHNNQNKKFKVGFLFSPSPNGNRGGARSLEFLAYRNANPGNNYNQFREAYYKQLLYFKHFSYDGANPVNVVQP